MIDDISLLVSCKIHDLIGNGDLNSHYGLTILKRGSIPVIFTSENCDSNWLPDIFLAIDSDVDFIYDDNCDYSLSDDFLKIGYSLKERETENLTAYSLKLATTRYSEDKPNYVTILFIASNDSDVVINDIANLLVDSSKRIG